MPTPLPDLSNEQKLTYIYHALKDQEARHRRAVRYRVFKGLLILGVVALVYTYPKQISEAVTEIVKPIISKQLESFAEQNKNNLINSLKGMLPENIEVVPTSSLPPIPAAQTSTGAKAKTGTTIPKKK